ncbi:MAG: UvrD-helicase domain-containing protein [Sphingobacteriales bacterium]|nr:MAG: UvrD-helicase domain-containing protein [Sphingobacteriales bacterium]
MQPNIFNRDTSGSGDFSYLTELNQIQREAVECINGPVMIIAGPGSGKTRVLTYRIAHLIRLGIHPRNILALTFTNKAAREMQERIRQIAGETAADKLWMGTFHSIFARILRIESAAIGYPVNFSVYDTEDSKNLIKTIVSELNLNPDNYKPNVVYNRISNAKNNLISPVSYAQSEEIRLADGASNLPRMPELYARYVLRCQQAGAMDFDDLLIKMYQLLYQHPEIAHKYQSRFKFLLVDEFQDTNSAQYAIIKKIAELHRSVCVVGDDAQSIYAFRGATIDNILNFERDYPEAQTFKLEQNYRSTGKIVAIANRVIAGNNRQITKNIWTTNDEGHNIQLLRAANDTEEARLVVDNIYMDRLRLHFKNEDFAILYRTNVQSRVFEEELRRKGIPSRVYGGVSFYQRKEVKDLIAYLRLTVNPQDEEALRRIINYPTRGIGNTTLTKVSALANQHQVSIWAVLEEIHRYELPKNAKDSLTNFVKMMQIFSNQQAKKDAHELAKFIGAQTGLIKQLSEDKTIEGISRYENLQELLNSIKEFVDEQKAKQGQEPDIVHDASLGSYLQGVALFTDLDKDEDENGKVKLMTIHTAKGLEFPCVYIVGMEEGLFPSLPALKSVTELEEERRLFYVAITRAKHKLHLSLAACRYRYGELQYTNPSRFIDEIASINVEQVGVKPKTSVFAKSDAYGSFKESNSSVSDNIRLAKQQQNKQPASKLNIPDNFKADDTAKLKAGDEVIHQRFGMGKVLNVEGYGEKRMAAIRFEAEGEKKIVLKFAQLMIVKK